MEYFTNLNVTDRFLLVIGVCFLVLAVYMVLDLIGDTLRE
jgi:hypothetical protein